MIYGSFALYIVEKATLCVLIGNSVKSWSCPRNCKCVERKCHCTISYGKASSRIHM